MEFDKGWQIKTKRVRTLDDYIDFLDDNRWRLDRLDFIMRPQAHFVLDSSGSPLVDRFFRMEADLGDLNHLLCSWGKKKMPTLNSNPPGAIKCSQRQIDRLAAIYVADMHLYESVSKQA